MAAERIHPVILCGGTGTRLWPLSRALYPKQLLPLTAERTMLQQTALRVQDAKRFAPPLVVCNEEHRFVVVEQLRTCGVTPRATVLEPEGRNTGPAAAVAAAMLTAEDPDALMLVMPSDHEIADTERFLAAVAAGRVAARGGALVTFGITPQGPESGYGYVQQAAPIDGAEGCFRVARFVEKPRRETAEAFLAEGGYFWNSGIFLFGAQTYLDELRRLEPTMVEAARGAVAAAKADLDFFRLDPTAFLAAPARSIDYAVLEHTQAAAVVPVDMGWNDVGSWSALWQIGDKDAAGNVSHGDVVTHDVHNAYLRGEGPLVCAVGVDDVVVVATEDATLVVGKDRAQDVGDLVKAMQANGRNEPNTHLKVYRPWGSYQTLRIGDRFQVKHIVVNPGQRLSLQKHWHRAEHWVVVRGTALATREDDAVLLRENESIYIPLGAVHRLENPGQVPLELIEVQSGGYLGEDDIVRFDDAYGRG